MDDMEFLEAKMNEVKDAEGGFSKRLYAQAARAIVKGVIKIVKFIMKKIAADKEKRAEWTKDMISDFRSKYPSFNFAICHVKHRTDFKGTQGTDWGHQHQELKVSFGKTVGYEIYWFREGTFERLGHGGWLNWAYSGIVKSATKKNSYIVFGRP